MYLFDKLIKENIDTIYKKIPFGQILLSEEEIVQNTNRFNDDHTLFKCKLHGTEQKTKKKLGAKLILGGT